MAIVISVAMNVTFYTARDDLGAGVIAVGVLDQAGDKQGVGSSSGPSMGSVGTATSTLLGIALSYFYGAIFERAC